MSIHFHPLRDTDYDALAEMFNDASLADGIAMHQVGEEIREDFESLPVNLDAHTFGAWSGGTLVGAAYAHHVQSQEREESCYVFGAVRPSFRGRGIGRRIFGDALAAAELILRASPSDVPKFIRADASRTNAGALRLFERAGLQPVRYFADLRRALSESSSPVRPTGFRIVPWDASRSEETRLVKNSAFRDHWGSTPMSSEHWMTMTTGFGSRPDLSYLAVSPQGSVVGFLVSHRYDNDDELLGSKYAWIRNVGTLADWRGRGVATALLTTALVDYHGAGMDFAALGVDSDNPTGAYRLYETLGFLPWRQTVMYQAELGSRD